MSALQSNAARVLPVRPIEPAVQPAKAPRPKFRIVEAPSTEKSSFRFMLLCVAIVVGAVIGALLLNTEMANGAYERSNLQRQLSQEVIVGEQLSSDLSDVSTAENLAKKAKELGMKQEVNPEVLHISSQDVAAKKKSEVAEN